MRQYDFTSASSRLKMKQVEQYIRRTTKGRTLHQIAVHMTMSPSGIGPYVARLCDDKVIHIAEYSQAGQSGHTPAVYQYGPVLFKERRRKPAYMNDPLLANFFGSNFMKHDPNKSFGANLAAKELDLTTFTGWFHPLTHQPARVGAYECVTMYGHTVFEAIPNKTHYRWWNGAQWSLPIEGNLDDEFTEPHVDHYPLDQAEYLPFAFRGYLDDPDPL